MRLSLLLLLLLATITSASTPTAAHSYTDQVEATSFDIQSFGQLPILHEGRIKPLDSFAKASLKTLSGKDRQAMAWLTETLFNPAFAENMHVIKVTHPDIVNMLELPARNTKLYSHAEVKEALLKHRDILASVLSTPEQKWTSAQRDLIKLSDKSVMLSDLLASVTLFLPLSVDLPKKTAMEYEYLADQNPTYMDMLKHIQDIQNDVTAIVKTKGEDLNAYNDAERKLAFLSFSLENIRLAAQNSILFKIVPMPGGKELLSPWDIVSNGQGHPQTARHFSVWQNMARAYHEQDYQLWTTNLTELEAMLASDLSPDIFRQDAQNAETLYNQIQPLQISLLLYSLAIISLIVSAFSKSIKRPAIKVAYILTIAGAAIHMAAIACRMYILMRPPVSTLYESIIFVGFITVLYGIFMYAKHKGSFWLYLSTVTGILIHVLALSHDQDGDSMMMLTAVLNTNFWLATHVICITIGYAFCLVTSGIAHYALYQNAYGGPAHKDTAKELFSHTHKAALLALLFSAIGTVLGGIWADQSWGRFWGWDPKENGAMLIVLWLVWVLHGRISGQMKELTVLAGLSYLSVIVALSWFGVNLLGVGLHAYGFTDSAAWGLMTFTAMETILIAALLYQAKRLKHNGAAHAS